jgi:hypothetical protein
MVGVSGLSDVDSGKNVGLKWRITELGILRASIVLNFLHPEIESGNERESQGAEFFAFFSLLFSSQLC